MKRNVQMVKRDSTAYEMTHYIRVQRESTADKMSMYRRYRVKPYQIKLQCTEGYSSTVQQKNDTVQMGTA